MEGRTWRGGLGRFRGRNPVVARKFVAIGTDQEDRVTSLKSEYRLRCSFVVVGKTAAVSGKEAAMRS